MEKKRFCVKTVCMIANQIISVLEFIHNKHILHRDIKPDNFVMGLADLSQYVYLLDFGLAKKYRSSRTLVQYPLVNKKKLTGTARYASINALKGYEHSRRDDLEAVGYVLMYFLRGSLPWQGMQAKTKEERYKKILQKKIDTSSYDLCYGFPEEFENYVDYTKNLEYTEQPDYEMLRGLFNTIMKRENYKFDYIYEWTTPEERRLRKPLTVKSDLESQNKTTSMSVKKTSLATNRQLNGDTNEENELIKKDYSNNNIVQNKTNVYSRKGAKISSITDNNNNFNHFSQRGRINEFDESIENSQEQVVCCSACTIF